MTALVFIRNDGPDSCEIDIGKRSVLLRPGDQLSVATSVAKLRPVEPAPLEYMGVQLEHARVGED